jgi:hypothetical protein
LVPDEVRASLAMELLDSDEIVELHIDVPLPSAGEALLLSRRPATAEANHDQPTGSLARSGRALCTTRRKYFARAPG